MKIITMALLLTCVSACQLLPEQVTEKKAAGTPHIQKKNVNYAHYYMWLKTLDNKKLQTEMAYQKSQSKGKNTAAIKVSLINSTPNYLLHNAYNAKDILNKHKEYIVSLNQGNKNEKNNYAFITLLNDQLNQHILLIEEQQNKNKRLEDLEAGISQLSSQIKQLKNIENTLNTRGQQNAK